MLLYGCILIGSADIQLLYIYILIIKIPSTLHHVKHVLYMSYNYKSFIYSMNFFQNEDVWERTMYKDVLSITLLVIYPDDASE